MAIFVLGILLILGFVFIGVVNQDIIRSGVNQQRSASNDLAEAGIRFAHNQLLFSAQGADFRMNPAGPASPNDPDFNYLRLDPDGNPLNGDQGGPDGFGAFTRVNFSNGRALVRIRYAPSDTFIFSSNPAGNLRKPGQARSYLIIESVGKVGRVNPNDPTTILGADRRESRKLIAFVSIGMLETGYFITNKDRVNRPAEIGYPRPLGARYTDSITGNTVDVNVTQVMGALEPASTFNGVPPGAAVVPFGGGMYSNASLSIHGTVQANLNATLGDGLLVAGTISGADNNAQLNVNRGEWVDPDGPGPAPGSWQTTSIALANNTNPSLDSRRDNFLTAAGVLRDEFAGVDAQGYARSVQYKAPPLIDLADPETGRTRFETLTRDSGVIGPSGNDGRFGHGSGIYVNNTQDRQMRVDEQGREDVGTAESLIYDWFNPNNGQANSGWQGPFYVPRGAYVQLLSDGFLIQRDGRAQGNERTWRRPDGSNTGSTTIRYRIGDPDGAGPNRQPYIINTFTPGVNISDPSPNFALGRPFNGVLMFEGNVRVRGVIPTDIQMTLVSNATIYVEGSITKGIVGSDYTVNDPVEPVSYGNLMRRPSRSTLMLMARDYVAINTTQFFGPSPSQALEEVSEAPGAVAYNPIRMREAGGTLTFRAEQLLDPESPNGKLAIPETWPPFVYTTNLEDGYKEFGTQKPISSKMLVTHTMDDGPAPFTFISMDVNFGLGSLANPSTYLFGMAPIFPYNSASGQGPYVPGYVTPGFTDPNYIPLYGLGSETWQRYPKFESAAFDIAPVKGTDYNFPYLTCSTSQGRYRMLAQETNDFTIRHNNVATGATNDWLLARVAQIPHDVRIEAGLYAQDGSFVVIPGNWFNPNPNDSRESYLSRINTLVSGGMSQAQAQLVANQERREAYGAHPEMPFYGEPIDVRIRVVGSITENMPVPIAQRAEWLRKWGWIGRTPSAVPELLPARHVPAGFNISGPDMWVPNLFLVHDPALSTGRTVGFDLPAGSNTSRYIRRDSYGRPLPPMPRLPVSPTLSYFGEVLP